MAIPPWHGAISRRKSPAPGAVGTDIGRRWGWCGRNEHANTPWHPSAGHTGPGGLVSALPRPFTPACHLLPLRHCWGWDAGPGEERRAHQSLPTDRTAFRMRLTPRRARALPLPRRGRLHRSLAQLLPAHRQRCALRVGIQAPAAHQHGPGWRHMQPPAPDELLEG
jgi:hypothetical protein